jgi:hypothetical protein
MQPIEKRIPLLEWIRLAKKDPKKIGLIRFVVKMAKLNRQSLPRCFKPSAALPPAA